MPALNLSVGHRLSQDGRCGEFEQRVSQAKAQHAEKINQLRDSWNGYVGAFDGVRHGTKGVRNACGESFRCEGLKSYSH